MACIRLIVGLGNPGPQYAKTRHNAGFWFIEELVRRCGATLRPESKFHGLTSKIEHQGASIALLEPQDFMNRSGFGVSAMSRFWRLAADDILVVHDELDFQPGTAKLKLGGGHGGHNGLRHIIEQLGSNGFYRLRVGIGHPGDRNRVADYVLSEPSVADKVAIQNTIDCASSEAVLSLLLKGDLSQATEALLKA